MSDAAQPQTKRDFRQEVTDQILEMLERGTAPWQKPWEPGTFQMPLNPTTDKPYRGGNALHLIAVAAKNGYQDPRWLTYRQAQENGWQVKKGEKGTHIEYWQFGAKSSTTPESPSPSPAAEPGTDTRERNGHAPIHRIYTVFNASQIEGVPPIQPKQPQEWEIVHAGEEILRNSGATIFHDQADRAYYNRRDDEIHLPPTEAFKSSANYYGTALHELAHWSGHPSRLNRATLNESTSFADPNYAKEELRAELASVFLAAERGIPHDPEQHAAYVGAWITALRSDKNEIFRAAKDAHTAADFLLELERAPELRRESSAQVAALEPGSSTVNVTAKSTATEHRNPTAAPAEQEAAKSLVAAQEIAKRTLGDHTRTYEPDTGSGKYRGEIIGETDHHIVQRLSPRSAAAHPKHLLAEPVAAGQNVLVAYSNQLAQLKPNHSRERDKALAR